MPAHRLSSSTKQGAQNARLRNPSPMPENGSSSLPNVEVPRPIPESSRRLVLALSGGHSNSSAALVERDGTCVGVVRRRLSLSPHVFPDPRDLGAQIRVLIDELFESSNIAEEVLNAVTLSMPGAARSTESDLVRRSIVESGCLVDPDQVVVVDDTMAGLLAGLVPLHETSGICAFAGTGASVIVGDALNAGTAEKLDGWGPLLGDHGSAFRIALMALQSACRSRDRRRQATEKLEFFSARVPECGGADGVQAWFDGLCEARRSETLPAWYVRVADLAHCICEAADQGVGWLAALVRRSAQDMSKTIKIARGRWRGKKDPALVLQGGLFAGCKTYLDEVHRLVCRQSFASIQLARYRPIVGAIAFLSLREGGGVAAVRSLVSKLEATAPSVGAGSIIHPNGRSVMPAHK